MLLFKEEKIRLDWTETPVPIKLRDIVLWIATHRNREMKLTTLMTSFRRTKEENAAVGGVSKTHIEGRAVDLRLETKLLGAEEMLRNYINRTFPVLAAGMPRVPAFNHNRGAVPHWHVQITRAEAKTLWTPPEVAK